MTNDYLYKKAPLVEVIAEIHWALKMLDSAPNSRIDPYYDLFREEFISQVGAEGFGHVQELIPSMVPIELVADQPQLRIRMNEDSWPLMQIGPGLMTANIVPPYQGWAAFEPFLGDAIEKFFSSYPLPTKTLRIERLHLRYIDGFDDSFGLKSYVDFAEAKLGMRKALSDSFVDAHVSDKSKFTFLHESRFENRSPEGSQANIKLSPGTVRGREAAILELRCESKYEDRRATDVNFMKTWFAEAHQTLHAQFEDLSTDDLKLVMGERTEIGAR
jgi:uncharacterized protein (TIGR04255 family)